MSTNSSWTPDEPSQVLLAERSWFQGALIGAIAYGIAGCLYFMTLHQLVRIRNSHEFKHFLPLLAYITVTFVFATLYMISLAKYAQDAFIDDRDYPGGPAAYEVSMFSTPTANLGNVIFTISDWMFHALLIWRFKVIYQTSNVPIWLLILLPCLILVCSVALGIAFLVQMSTSNPNVTHGINFTVPYLNVSLVLNLLLTTAIVLRLLFFRRHIYPSVGSKNGTHHTSVTAMAIESAALYSVYAIPFLVLFSMKNPVSVVFMDSLNPVQTITAFLIVFRIAQGKAWTEETATHVTTTGNKDSSPTGKGKMTHTSGSATPETGADVEKNGSGNAQ